MSQPVSTSKAPERISGMFDLIAPQYDFLNHLLSAGLDVWWRRCAIRGLSLTGAERVLDMCTGTADLAMAAVRAGGRGAKDVIGIDFAGEMLRIGLAKSRRAGLDGQIHLVRGDATAVPLPDGSCDAAMVAFGIRNVLDRPRACREFCRVLRPGGRLAVLEFGMPTTPVVRQVYAWYFRNVLPRIGRLVSRHREAYDYLPASVNEFPPPPEFARMLTDAGFSTVQTVPLSLGTVYLYIARKS